MILFMRVGNFYTILVINVRSEKMKLQIFTPLNLTMFDSWIFCKTYESHVIFKVYKLYFATQKKLDTFSFCPIRTKPILLI